MNKVFSRIRRFAPVVIVVASLAFMASCTASKKYGCPESMNIGSIIGY